MLEKIKRKIENVDTGKNYSVTEILELGVIINSKQLPSAMTIYRLIEGGRLKAKNIGYGKKFGRYIVSGKDLKEYLTKWYEVVTK